MDERDIQQEIRAAFDSVNLIITNNGDEETIQRNLDHLVYKMGDVDFVNGLTTEQNNIILGLIK